MENLIKVFSTSDELEMKLAICLLDDNRNTVYKERRR